MNYDVIVFGGGTAGVSAAAQSALTGARTLLVEKNGTLGGTITIGGVNYPGLFHAWGRQIIAGLGWRLVTRCVEETGGRLPDFTDTTLRHHQHQVRVNSAVYAALCDELILGAGVEPLFHTMPAGLSRNDGRWSVQLCDKSGLKTVSASVIVDCTGDADAVRMVGADVRVPDAPQPATLCCSASGYDFEELDLDEINQHFKEKVENGALSYADAGWNPKNPNVTGWLRKHGNNVNHLCGGNSHTSEGKTRLEMEGRRSFLRLFRFLREQTGLTALSVDHLACECGVRETVTIVGEETVTVEDYVSGRCWPDAVCNSFYPIDLHRVDGAGLDCRPLAEGVVPTVPRGALIPKDVPGFLAAGRCVSSDRLANSALRVQATCMATGQAAGALAALAANVPSSADPREVSMKDLRAELEANEAIVPDPS